VERLTLILGGARSGKSRHAERLITALPAPWIYIATAEALDAEMAERIARHRADRGPGWDTREAPYELPALLRAIGPTGTPILVDCLTLWLSNLLCAERDASVASDDLLDALEAVRGPLVLVSNEVGLGIVPDNALARAFRDAAGRLHQRIAERADRVILTVAGLPLTVK
jgi:adenosylcobinamide kinase/adenosylcobinamide-phosphate guanylyltransferase